MISSGLAVCLFSYVCDQQDVQLGIADSMEGKEGMDLACVPHLTCRVFTVSVFFLVPVSFKIFSWPLWGRVLFFFKFWHEPKDQYNQGDIQVIWRINKPCILLTCWFLCARVLINKYQQVWLGWKDSIWFHSLVTSAVFMFDLLFPLRWWIDSF